MRYYDNGEWGIAFIFSLRGSVFPKAFAWAAPAAAMAVGFHFLLHMDPDFRQRIDDSLGPQLRTSQIFVAYNFLLTFVLTFRSTQAYGRWWEGGTLLLQARGEWFNCYSSLVAFRTADTKRWKEVKCFQKVLATLMSMLFCSALHSVAQDEIKFEVAAHVELLPGSADRLRECPDKCEVLVNWIQRLVVTNMEAGILPVPPPVMTRVFQELSRGMVNINNARKISDFLLPFPYAQLITCMLLLNLFLTPLIFGVFLTEWYSAGLLSFISIFAFSALNCIATEIECPFGRDANDLPMRQMQLGFNASISQLLDAQTQTLPVDMKELMLDEALVAKEDSLNNFRRWQSVMGETRRRRYRNSTLNTANFSLIDRALGLVRQISPGRSGFKDGPGSKDMDQDGEGAREAMISGGSFEVVTEPHEARGAEVSSPCKNNASPLAEPHMDATDPVPPPQQEATVHAMSAANMDEAELTIHDPQAACAALDGASGPRTDTLPLDERQASTTSRRLAESEGSNLPPQAQSDVRQVSTSSHRRADPDGASVLSRSASRVRQLSTGSPRIAELESAYCSPRMPAESRQISTSNRRSAELEGSRTPPQLPTDVGHGLMGSRGGAKPEGAQSPEHGGSRPPSEQEHERGQAIARCSDASGAQPSSAQSARSKTFEGGTDIADQSNRTPRQSHWAEGHSHVLPSVGHVRLTTHGGNAQWSVHCNDPVPLPPPVNEGSAQGPPGTPRIVTLHSKASA